MKKPVDYAQLEQFPFLHFWNGVTNTERLVLIIGVIAAIVHGSSLPLLFLFMGDITDNFIDYTRGKSCNFTESTCAIFAQQDSNFNFTQSKLNDLQNVVDTNMFIIWLILAFAVVSLVAGFIHSSLFNIIAARVSERLHRKFFKKLISQEMAFYETETTPGELTVKITNDLGEIKKGMGDKVSQNIQFSCTIICGIAIGLTFSWSLSLAILAGVPFIALAAQFAVNYGTKLSGDEKVLYGRATETANEILSSIRTITAFGMQKMSILKYDKHLVQAKHKTVQAGKYVGIGFGFTYGIMFLIFAVTFALGTKLFDVDKIKPGTIIKCFYCVVTAAFMLSQIGGNMEFINTGKAAALGVYKILYRKSKIDPTSTQGKTLKPDQVKGYVPEYFT